METVENWQCFNYDELTSTNDEALRLSSHSGKARLVVIADRQTAGRGRRGRSWTSPSGNLYMSQILPWSRQDNGILCLICSLAILMTIRQFDSEADLKLKWPNDVLLCGKKVSGILLEVGAEENMVCGIGVNIKVAPQNEKILYATCSLRDCGINCECREFMQQYLYNFNQLQDDYTTKGAAEISELWQQFAHNEGERITVRLPKKEISGLYRGLNAKGFLLLETEDKQVITVSAGDVFVMTDTE